MCVPAWMTKRHVRAFERSVAIRPMLLPQDDALLGVSGDDAGGLGGEDAGEDDTGAVRGRRPMAGAMPISGRARILATIRPWGSPR